MYTYALWFVRSKLTALIGIAVYIFDDLVTYLIKQNYIQTAIGKALGISN